MKAALLLTLALGAAPFAAAQSPAPAPQSANRFAASIKPAETFESGSLLVERHGSKGRPVILIPGLASGPWVWQDVIRQFKDEFTLYVVTLPGFDGRPAVAGDPFDNARAALGELIASRKLVDPVIVGHSIGATLAIALAEDLPGKLGGVVAIDGMPVFPQTENMPPEGRPAMAEAARQRMAGLNGPAFAASQQQYMRSIGVVDMGKADDAAQLMARSDPAAVASYVGAVLGRDLRPGLPGIKAPVLVLAPYYAPDAAAMGGITSAQKVAYYQELMKGTPRLQVEAIDNARHFPMIDQPQATTDAIRRFLKQL